MKPEIQRVFSFYFFLKKKSSRSKMFFLLSSASILLALIIRFYQLAGQWTESGQIIFQNILMVFFPAVFNRHSGSFLWNVNCQ